VSAAAQRAAQPLRFLAVGAAGYGVNLLTFALLVRTGVGYVLASIASYLVANALMYVGNRYFTFRLGHDGFWSAYARYLLVGCVVVALNAVVLAALVEGAGLDETLAQALSLLAVTPVAFVLFKRWTFRLTS
jgi:putative flippase GtrA